MVRLNVDLWPQINDCWHFSANYKFLELVFFHQHFAIDSPMCLTVINKLMD